MYCYSCHATKTAKHSYSTNYSSDETKHFHYCINGCGRKLDEEDHDWTDWTTSGNYKYRSCKICYRSESQYLDGSDEHHWSDWEAEDDYNEVRKCTDEGCDAIQRRSHSYGDYEDTDDGHKRTCKTCGRVSTTGHNYSQGVDLGNGKHERTCSICGKKIQEQHYISYQDLGDKHIGYCYGCDKTVEEEDHEPTYYSVFSPYLYSNSSSKYHEKHCAKCGHVYSDTKEKHTFSNYVINDYSHSRSCTKCGYNESHEHRLSDYKAEGAKYHYRECEDCGYKNINTHSWTDWEVNDDGTYTRECTVCGYKMTSQHPWNDYFVKTDDKTHTCGTVDSDDAETLTEDHVWGPWNNGMTEHYRTCIICGAREQEKHQLGDAKSDSYNNNYQHYRICSVCGNRVYELHEYGKWIKLDDGMYSHTCKDCGFKETVKHKFGDWKDNGNGKHVRTCTIDGCEEKEEADHNYYYSWIWKYSHDTNDQYDTKDQYDSNDQYDSGDEYTEGVDKENHNVYCFRCGYHTTEPHDWSEDWASNEEGHYHYCTKCILQETIEEHTYGEWKKNKDDEYERSCSVCGYTQTVDHLLGDPVDNGNGTHTRKSLIPGDDYSETEKHTAEYDSGKDLDNGTHQAKCECGAVLIESHDYGDWDYNNTNHYRNCRICDHEESGAHDFSEWQDDGEGSFYKECKTCGYKVTGKHMWSDWKKVDDKTCQRTCEGCGKKQRKLHKSYGVDESINDEMHYDICENCGEKYPVKHTFAYSSYDSKTHYKYCTQCDYEAKNTEAHTWGDWQEVSGNKYRYCTKCGYGQSYEESLHHFDEGKVTKYSTCSTQGTKVYKCTDEGCKETKEEKLPLDPSNHEKVIEDYHKKDATCTEDGYSGDTYCEACGTTITKGSIIKATGHTLDEGKVTKAATPTQPTTPATPAQPATSTPTTPATTEKTTAEKVDEGTKAVTSRITSRGNDKDPSGSTYKLLQLKQASASKSSIKVKWNRVSGTNVYLVYTGKCGSKYKFVKSVKGLSYTSKKLNKGTYYKLLVVALNSEGQTIATSKVIHITTKGSKTGNIKKIKLNKKSITLKKKKSYKLKAKVTKDSKKIKTHRGVTYESANPKIATVSKSGKITAKKKGKTTIYAYAQNGVSAKVIVKVK